MCRCHMQWYTRFRLLLFFFTDPAPTVIYTLSLHDALPICGLRRRRFAADRFPDLLWRAPEVGGEFIWGFARAESLIHLDGRNARTGNDRPAERNGWIDRDQPRQIALHHRRVPIVDVPRERKQPTGDSTCVPIDMLQSRMEEGAHRELPFA